MPRAAFGSTAGRAFVYLVAAIVVTMILTATFVGPAPLECGGGAPSWVDTGPFFGNSRSWSCSTASFGWSDSIALDPIVAFAMGLLLVVLARFALERLARSPKPAPLA